MPEMRIAIDRRAADIQPDKWRMKRFEWFLPAGQAIVDFEIVLHEKLIIKTKIN
jgi:hypothetical protein